MDFSAYTPLLKVAAEAMGEMSNTIAKTADTLVDQIDKWTEMLEDLAGDGIEDDNHGKDEPVEETEGTYMSVKEMDAALNKAFNEIWGKNRR